VCHADMYFENMQGIISGPVLQKNELVPHPSSVFDGDLTTNVRILGLGRVVSRKAGFMCLVFRQKPLRLHVFFSCENRR
jgi:hypothetical protein